MLCSKPSVARPVEKGAAAALQLRQGVVDSPRSRRRPVVVKEGAAELAAQIRGQRPGGAQRRGDRGDDHLPAATSRRAIPHRVQGPAAPAAAHQHRPSRGSIPLVDGGRPRWPAPCSRSLTSRNRGGGGLGGAAEGGRRPAPPPPGARPPHPAGWPRRERAPRRCSRAPRAASVTVGLAPARARSTPAPAPSPALRGPTCSIPPGIHPRDAASSRADAAHVDGREAGHVAPQARAEPGSRGSRGCGPCAPGSRRSWYRRCRPRWRSSPVESARA